MRESSAFAVKAGQFGSPCSRKRQNHPWQRQSEYLFLDYSSLLRLNTSSFQVVRIMKTLIQTYPESPGQEGRSVISGLHRLSSNSYVECRGVSRILQVFRCS